jgi:hypothetical protein
MTNRNTTFLVKRSNVPGKIPSPGDLKLGELALNTADAILYASGTTANDILPIGWDRINRTGDTVNGDFVFNGSIDVNSLSASTIYSGSTNLYDIFLTSGDLSGTSVSAGSNIIVQQSGNDYKVSVSGSPIFNQLTTSGLTTINSNFIVTGNTNLEAMSASTVYVEDYIQFNTGYTPGVSTEGKMYWDEPNGTISLGMHGSQVSQQIGLEYYYYVKNQSGATIENGRVVRAAGTLGASGRILGKYMIANGTIPAKYTLGVATEDIINGDDGYVTEFGLVRGIDTTGTPYGETWSEGDVLWVSPTFEGGLTNVEPNFPNLKIEMAIVIRANANGSIFVRPHRYPSTNEIQDIISSGRTNNSILQYNASISGYTNTTTPTLTSVSATTISGGTIYSGSTDLSAIFQPINKSPYNTFILTAGTSYSFSGTVNTLSINKTAGSATQVNLPSNPNTNDFFVVKDRAGVSFTYPITMSGGTKTIDGNTSYVIKLRNNPSLTFLYDGEEYIVI